MSAPGNFKGAIGAHFASDAFQQEEEGRLTVFVVHNRIEVPPDKADAFARGFAANMKTYLANVPGLKRSVLLKPEANGQPFVATMEFDSERDFETWRKSESFRGAHGGTRGPGSASAATLETFTIFEEFTG